MDEGDSSSLSSSTNRESENASSFTVCRIFKSREGSEDDDDDDIGEYYFESDHLALKGNTDYRNLLKTVALLEAQRMKAIQDVDSLIEAKEAALANPIEFVERLQRNEDLDLPKPQSVCSLPGIDWDKYSRSVNRAAFTHKHMTRHKKPPAAAPSPASPPPPPPQINDGNSGSSSNEIKTESDESSALIRGRIPASLGKSQTFNQLWTVEEQKRLESLLDTFPPEDVEARRWEKIAKALGNRTPQQVASRVQKYFIKLTKVGLPVPGRTPNLNNYSRKLGVHRHQRHNRFLFQQSTFFASREPPVFMSDYDDDNTNYSATSSSMDDDQRWTVDDDKTMDDDYIPQQLRNTEEYQELIYLKRLKRSKEQKKWQNAMQHNSISCDRCGCEPIFGKRWRCRDCPSSSAVNLCDDCSDSNFETSTHISGHRLQPVQDAQQSFVDGDYTQFVQGDYNYLDPNYMPAT